MVIINPLFPKQSQRVVIIRANVHLLRSLPANNVQIVFECTYRIVERLSFLRHRTFENANNHTATQYMALLQTKTHSTNDSTFKIHESALRYPHLRNILIRKPVNHHKQ